MTVVSRSEEPPISVVLTVYNQAGYLPAAVDSVLRQTFADFELIAIDDGSTDGGLEVLRAIEESTGGDLRVCTHEGNENRGIAATYSRGIAEARGPLIAFLEGDDRWSVNYLEEKVSVFERYPEVGVVFSPLRVVHEGIYGSDMVLRQSLLGLLFPKQKPFRNFGNLLRHNNVATFSTFMARRSLLQGLPRPMADRLPYLDWWMLTLLSMEASFYLDDRSRTYWRQSPGSYMGRQTFREHRQGLIVFLRELYRNVAERSGCLGERESARFRQMACSMPLFADFYLQPDFRRFTRLFRRDPRWALESLASCVVNSMKFRK